VAVALRASRSGRARSVLDRAGTAAAAALTGALATALTVTACFRRGRRFLADRAWCIMTPHRVRVGCVQTWIHSRSGRLPIILATRRRPLGERVYLWCRAGISPADFSAARGELAAACMAKEVQVSRHVRYAHLVALDVIRREPPPEWAGQPWYNTGTLEGTLTIPAPRELADAAFWLGDPPRQEPPRWIAA
jgi:hypothetical protein